jgi:hypothetical protein
MIDFFAKFSHFFVFIGFDIFKRNEGNKKFEIDLAQIASNEEAEEKVLKEKKLQEEDRALNKVLLLAEILQTFD